MMVITFMPAGQRPVDLIDTRHPLEVSRQSGNISNIINADVVKELKKMEKQKLDVLQMFTILRDSFILIGIVIQLVSCNTQGRCNLSIPLEVANNWKSDSIGCLNKRSKIVTSGQLDFKDFIGHNISCVVAHLGRYNNKRVYKDAIEYDYYSSCCYIQPPKDLRFNLYASRVIIETDLKGNILGCHSALP